jgi:CheY-like chemotaxis protein/predicted kinase
MKWLILIGGHPYSGRATLASSLACSVPSCQLVRYRDTPRGAASAARYQALVESAERAFGHADTVVVVAPMSRAAHREEFVALAQRLGVRLTYVECTCSLAVMKRRIFGQYASAAASFLELRAARAAGQREGYARAGTELAGAQVVRLDCDGARARLQEELHSALGIAARKCATEPAESDDSKLPLAFVVDDDKELGCTLCEVLHDAGCRTELAHDGRSALRRASELTGAPELVLLDYSLPDQSGLDLARQLRQRWPGALFVMLSAFDEPWLCDEAFREHFDNYLRKPLAAADLVRVLNDLPR